MDWVCGGADGDARPFRAGSPPFSVPNSPGIRLNVLTWGTEAWCADVLQGAALSGCSPDAPSDSVRLPPRQRPHLRSDHSDPALGTCPAAAVSGRKVLSALQAVRPSATHAESALALNSMTQTQNHTDAPRTTTASRVRCSQNHPWKPISRATYTSPEVRS